MSKKGIEVPATGATILVLLLEEVNLARVADILGYSELAEYLKTTPEMAPKMMQEFLKIQSNFKFDLKQSTRINNALMPFIQLVLITELLKIAPEMAPIYGDLPKILKKKIKSNTSVIYELKDINKLLIKNVNVMIGGSGDNNARTKMFANIGNIWSTMTLFGIASALLTHGWDISSLESEKNFATKQLQKSLNKAVGRCTLDPNIHIPWANRVTWTHEDARIGECVTGAYRVYNELTHQYTQEFEAYNFSSPTTTVGGFINSIFDGVYSFIDPMPEGGIVVTVNDYLPTYIPIPSRGPSPTHIPAPTYLPPTPSPTHTPAPTAAPSPIALPDAPSNMGPYLSKFNTLKGFLNTATYTNVSEALAGTMRGEALNKAKKDYNDAIKTGNSTKINAARNALKTAIDTENNLQNPKTATAPNTSGDVPEPIQLPRSPSATPSSRPDLGTGPAPILSNSFNLEPIVLAAAAAFKKVGFVWEIVRTSRGFNWILNIRIGNPLTLQFYERIGKRGIEVFFRPTFVVPKLKNLSKDVIESAIASSTLRQANWSSFLSSASGLTNLIVSGISLTGFLGSFGTNLYRGWAKLRAIQANPNSVDQIVGQAIADREAVQQTRITATADAKAKTNAAAAEAKAKANAIKARESAGRKPEEVKRRTAETIEALREELTESNRASLSNSDLNARIGEYYTQQEWLPNPPAPGILEKIRIGVRASVWPPAGTQGGRRTRKAKRTHHRKTRSHKK